MTSSCRAAASRQRASQRPDGSLDLAWRKAPPALVALFDDCIPMASAIERRQLFGYPAAFVNGHLFAGLHQERMILRLGPADRARIVASGAAWVWQR